MNLKNVLNTYSVNFKVQYIQNYVFNTKNEMKLNMNMDSAVEYELKFNNSVKFMPYSTIELPIQSKLTSKPWTVSPINS